MKPYTIGEVENDLAAAINSGEQSLIEHLGATLDAMETATVQVTTLAAALWYAEGGLPVFPIQPGLKIPYPGTRGCKDASTDAETIRAWWDHWPDSNLAVATGHLVDVVDIDGLPGQRSRTEHWDMFANLPALAKVSTPRAGGMHIYVPAAGVGNRAGLLPGIDYRGTGGYVLAPPSRTPDGVYRFLTPLDPAELGKAAA